MDSFGCGAIAGARSSHRVPPHLAILIRRPQAPRSCRFAERAEGLAQAPQRAVVGRRGSSPALRRHRRVPVVWRGSARGRARERVLDVASEQAGRGGGSACCSSGQVAGRQSQSLRPWRGGRLCPLTRFASPQTTSSWPRMSASPSLRMRARTSPRSGHRDVQDHSPGSCQTRSAAPSGSPGRTTAAGRGGASAFGGGGPRLPTAAEGPSHVDAGPALRFRDDGQHGGIPPEMAGPPGQSPAHETR